MQNGRLNILVTNDDGYKAKGVKVLAKMMSSFGNVRVIAPKYHQSGMGMAVSLGVKRLAYKELGIIDGVRWSYLDATPASCVKFGISYPDPLPDIVVSGINHGSNASTAACYSGTLGAAQEAALNKIPAIGVSLDSFKNDPDFSCVEEYFPDIFEALVALSKTAGFGVYYNVNFPNIKEIKGIRTANMGLGRWVREFTQWNPAILEKAGFTADQFGSTPLPPLEEGEVPYMMVGDYVDYENTLKADHHLMAKGFITVTAHNIISCDSEESERLNDTAQLNRDFDIAPESRFHLDHN